MLYVPVNNFSAMSGQFPAFLGWTSTKQQITCLAEGHNTVTPVRLTSNPSIPSLMLYQLSHCSPLLVKFFSAEIRGNFFFQKDIARWEVTHSQNKVEVATKQCIKMHSFFIKMHSFIIIISQTNISINGHKPLSYHYSFFLPWKCHLFTSAAYIQVYFRLDFIMEANSTKHCCMCLYFCKNSICFLSSVQ